MFKDHLQLHFIVLLFGFTGVLGKLISIDTLELVSYRMFLAAIGMLIYAVATKKSFRLPRKSLFQILGIGVIVSLHWLAFFQAVKVSNVSVALGCLASSTLFTSFLEPLINKKRLFWIEVVIGAMIILGLYIITQFAFQYYLGIIYSLIAAFLGSLFGILNQQVVRKHNPTIISFYEMLSGCLVVSIYTFGFTDKSLDPSVLSFEDMGYLLILAWLCTTYAFVGITELLQRLSAFTVSLAINMEPIYAITLAYLIFGDSEKMEAGFYVGAVIIIGTILMYPFLKRRFAVR